MKQYKEDLSAVLYGPAMIHHHTSRNRQPWLMAHWHDQMELIRLHCGEMTVGCEDIATLSPGDIYIIPPKTPHYIICCNEGTVYDVVMFDVRSFYNDTDISRKYLEPIFDGRAKFQLCTNQPEITACFDQMVALSQGTGFQILPVMYRLLDLLFSHALVEMNANVLDRNRISQVTEYMKANLTEKITTTQLAQKFGYSREHFCRLFKEITQVTPMQYLRLFRLERALRLLNEGKYSISEVSDMCGFSDPNYFTRCFRTFFGTTPTGMQHKE